VDFLGRRINAEFLINAELHCIPLMHPSHSYQISSTWPPQHRYENAAHIQQVINMLPPLHTQDGPILTAFTSSPPTFYSAFKLPIPEGLADFAS